jgi:hypothetical protein
MEDVHTAVREMTIETKKSEQFLLINGILIYSSRTNLECMCNDMSELFIDGTFKWCPKYFSQMYTLRGCKNGNYVPLLYALLPVKDEKCYRIMWDLILSSF